MGFRNDNSPHPRDWTNAKLMAEARNYANLKTFGGSLPKGDYTGGFPADHGDAIREATRLYRQTWTDGVLDELERRFLRVKAPA